MAADETRIELRPQFFDLTEQTLVTHGDLSATAFRYASGVEAVRLRNGAGSLVMLPFQGQQIWSAEFGGRKLTMKSMFEEPNATQNYLENYGGFLLHCGATAMGVPAAGDTHPVHGELPNAPYQIGVCGGRGRRGRRVHRPGRELPVHGCVQLQLRGRDHWSSCMPARRVATSRWR